MCGTPTHCCVTRTHRRPRRPIRLRTLHVAEGAEHARRCRRRLSAQQWANRRLIWFDLGTVLDVLPTLEPCVGRRPVAVTRLGGRLLARRHGGVIVRHR